MLLRTVLVSLVSLANTSLASVEISGIIEMESAVDRSGLDKSEVRFEPRVDVSLGPNIWLTGKARVIVDARDEIERGEVESDSRSSFSKRYALANHVDVEIRELYADFSLGEALFRIGKQQVVWGQADGLRVLDVINPLSQREFILGDFEDRRIPTWMINVEFPIGSMVLQGLLIPDQTYEELPPRGSSFRFKALVNRNVHYDRPSKGVMDSDVGLKLSAYSGGWDLTLNYLYHYDDLPMLEVVNESIEADYYRSRLYGASASSAVGDFVFRFEIGHSDNRWVNDRNAFSTETSAVFGLDFGGISETFLSLQYFTAHTDFSDTERATFTMTRDLLNDVIVLNFLAIHDLSEDDGLIQAHGSYQLTSSLKASVGVDYFYGSQRGDFGQFNERDRVTFGIEYSF